MISAAHALLGNTIKPKEILFLHAAALHGGRAYLQKVSFKEAGKRH